MRWVLVLTALSLAGCSHDERPGTTAGESVPAPRPVVENAIPRGMPPATPPIPPTSRSAQQQPTDGGRQSVEVYGPGMGPRAVPRPPPPNPIGNPVDGGVSPAR